MIDSLTVNSIPTQPSEAAKIDSQVFELYKELLAQENFNHNIYIISLLSILAILVGLTFWWNHKGASDFINKKIEEETSKLKSTIDLLINEKTNSVLDENLNQLTDRLLILEATVARSMAGINEHNGYLNEALDWWLASLSHLLEVNSEPETVQRHLLYSCEGAIDVIDLIKKRDKKSGTMFTMKDKSSKLNTINSLPETLLNYKEPIKRFLEEINEE